MRASLRLLDGETFSAGCVDLFEIKTERGFGDSDELVWARDGLPRFPPGGLQRQSTFTQAAQGSITTQTVRVVPKSVSVEMTPRARS
jgi:hypothetical protein